MPVTNVKSEWSSGNLIFKRKVAGTAASVEFGVDDTGVDVKMYGATTGKYCLWDESADKWINTGTTDAGTALEADSYTVGGTAGVDFTSGSITSLQIIKGIVVYAA